MIGRKTPIRADFGPAAAQDGKRRIASRQHNLMQAQNGATLWERFPQLASILFFGGPGQISLACSPRMWYAVPVPAVVR
jgi:hypothetical protein